MGWLVQVVQDGIKYNFRGGTRQVEKFVIRKKLSSLGLFRVFAQRERDHLFEKGVRRMDVVRKGIKEP